MNIFGFTDYRLVLKTMVKDRKQFERKFGFNSLADAARIQRPYMSKVMNGTAQLSSDQMFLISDFLKMTGDEQDYMQLLLEHDRTGVSERKQRLAQKIAEISRRHIDSASHLSAKVIASDAGGGASMADYYLDPFVQIVHIAISIDEFARNPSALSAELNLPGARIHSILATLERLNLAAREGNRLVARDPQIHLPKSSPVYRSWINQIKLLTAGRTHQLNDDDFYSFTTIFSASAQTKKQLHTKFLEFLKGCEKEVTEAPAKKVFQMSFDLFPWTT